MVAQSFFGSAVYTVVGPYMAEIWPARLRASGMGLSYGVGNCGKFIGPLGLALIMGAGDLIKPAAPNLVMLGPALSYFAVWYIVGVIGFWAFGFEPKGRTFDEIDSRHDALAPAVHGYSRTRRVAIRLRAFHQGGTAGLPAMYGLREFPEERGLMPYGPSFFHSPPARYHFRGQDPERRQACRHSCRADDDQVELVINRKTANALDLSVPPTLLSQADEVIE